MRAALILPACILRVCTWQGNQQTEKKKSEKRSERKKPKLKNDPLKARKHTQHGCLLMKEIGMNYVDV